jgi:tetratricopeptide (TPR) repeat protein
MVACRDFILVNRANFVSMSLCQLQVSLVKVGITLLLLHRFEEALWSFREALSVRKNSLGPLHPSTARIYNNIGCVYVEFNEYRQARRAFEAALDTQRNALVHEPNSGPLMFGTATTLCNLGYLYRIRSMHDKATAVLKEAAELQEIVLGKYHSTVLSTLDNLADSCCNSGNGNEALRYYNTVLERFQLSGTEFGDRNNKRSFRAESILHYKMSRVHRLRNDRENQLTSLQLALKAVRAVNDCNNSSNGTEGVCLSSGTPTDSLERRLLSDIRVCRELMEKEELKWI